jgi:hypothetical protein
MSEGEPVRVLEEVLEGLEGVRRYAGKDVLYIATVRYQAQERGRRDLAVWIHRHPEEYGRGLLDGFRAEDKENGARPPGKYIEGGDH